MRTPSPLTLTSLAVLLAHAALTGACSKKQSRADGASCESSSDCASLSCQNGRCAAPAPAVAPPSLPPPPVVPAPAPTPPTPPPAPVAQPEPADASAPDPNAPEPITAGRHRCSFTEAGSDYQRRCTVTLRPDGSFQVTAPGTSLNPTQGFSFVATGAPPRYNVQGTLTAFTQCTGPFTAVANLDGGDSRPYYTIAWGNGCGIRLYN